jgi:hypothetical protein
MMLLPTVPERTYANDGAPDEQRGEQQALPETRKCFGLQ